MALLSCPQGTGLKSATQAFSEESAGAQAPESVGHPVNKDESFRARSVSCGSSSGLPTLSLYIEAHHQLETKRLMK